MKQIDSDALGILNRTLGLTGAGAPVTELTDGIVDQTLSINEIARRGRTQVGTSGIYTGVLRTVHTDAEALTTSVDPYAVGAGRLAPFPDPIPRQFDVWLLGTWVNQVSGAGTLAGVLHYTYPDSSQGFGVDDSGVAVVVSAPLAIAYWTSLGALNTTFGVLADGGGTAQPRAPLNFRIPRGTTGDGGLLSFTALSSLTVTYDCYMLLGVFPMALGQDVNV